MVNQPRWKKIDHRTLQDPPSQLDYELDQCFYARELIKGFDRSPDNQMIWNYKKSLERKGNPEWFYKENAIKQFAHELSMIFIKNTQYAVCTIPSSKEKNDPLYDSRLEDTIKAVQSINPNVIYYEPIAVKETVLASHQGGSRSIPDLLENYKWLGFKEREPEQLVVIDDVVTSGAHFKAYQKMIANHSSCYAIHGIFWALTRNPGLNLIEDDLS